MKEPCPNLRGPAGVLARCPAGCPRCGQGRQQVVYSCALGRLCLPRGYLPNVLSCSSCPYDPRRK